MARKRRSYGPNGCTYVVHCRINDIGIMRFDNRLIAKVICDVLAEAKTKFGFTLNMFTIMGNHTHKKIHVHGNSTDISRIMHWINGMIAMRYNKITGHRGRLWRERFKSYVLHDWSYFMNCASYIALNPERAHITNVERYPFGWAIFLYKSQHPFKEFERYRNLCNEAYSGYFEDIKALIRAYRDKTIP